VVSGLKDQSQVCSKFENHFEGEAKMTCIDCGKDTGTPYPICDECKDIAAYRMYEQIKVYFGNSLDHVCLADKRFRYEGDIGAPGYGKVYQCEHCGKEWIKRGDEFLDPQLMDVEDMELQRWQVI